jgi:phosphoglycerate dehydrogenase-like enzyme
VVATGAHGWYPPPGSSPHRSPSAIDVLHAAGHEVVDGSVLDRSALLPDIEGAEALIVRSATTVDEPLLAAAGRLAVVARAGSGVDNIDVVAATARGILVLNAPGANSVSMAERAAALGMRLIGWDPWMNPDGGVFGTMIQPS